ncbi:MULTISPECIES: phage tail sheath subtilisin-like domain-containing protein [Vibrio]|uniref:phage tail sheath subtilisin-like domain-containing protein n=1 Tax=Vibrio TaxID=662 RepID=UPI000C822811|nr:MULTISPECIES: phage tail sheath subtilisin-like domain-containing protein [Vibrio]CAK2694024.1 Phage tail protein [Vibrio crassostreae]MCC4881625.1 phage tail sheath subtilisin-like domain-containing protein [Vibrio splendidus]PMN13791.1 phage tail protein [Vibrio lentus]PTO70152.1 phage tail protein [Vibrio splendidus]PTO78360.1 phage tail protein [Vibrio splendidus]
MSIGFAEVPSTARVPGVYIEIDNSLANSAEDLQVILAIGNAVSDATVAPNKVTLCMDETIAAASFGANSDIVEMITYFRKQDKTMPIFAVSVEDSDTASALAALGDVQYHHIMCSLNDSTTIRELGTFLEERYGALEQVPGIAYLPKKGTHAELITFAPTSNCALINFLPINNLGDSAEAPLSDAAAIGAWVGQIAPSLAIDPCRPLQTLKLNGVYSLAAQEWDWAERNLFLYEGLSTYTVNSANEVLVERAVTAYTENAAGVTDNSYLDVMTPATAMYFRQKQRSLILSVYPRHKVAKDGTKFAKGQPIVTPTMFKAKLLTLYRDLEYQGIVQDFDGYKKSLIVELDETNKQRVNYQDSPQFVNGLIIVAGKIQFRK